MESSSPNSDLQVFLFEQNDNVAEYIFTISKGRIATVLYLQNEEKMFNQPEKELCLNTLLGLLGLLRLVRWAAAGLLLTRDVFPCWGEVKPWGSRQESLSSSEEDSTSAEVKEEMLIRSLFPSCKKKTKHNAIRSTWVNSIRPRHVWWKFPFYLC